MLYREDDVYDEPASSVILVPDNFSKITLTECCEVMSQNRKSHDVHGERTEEMGCLARPPFSVLKEENCENCPVALAIRHNVSSSLPDCLLAWVIPEMRHGIKVASVFIAH